MTILLIIALILAVLSLIPQVAGYPMLAVSVLLVILALLLPRLGVG